MLKRGAYRLELARKLLKMPVGADVLAHLKSLPAEEHERWSGLVDWVEAYERLDRIVKPLDGSENCIL